MTFTKLILAEKLARALEIPLYQLFYEGEEPPDVPTLAKGRTPEKIAWGSSSGKETRMLEKFRQLLSRMSESDRRLLLYVTQKMAKP